MEEWKEMQWRVHTPKLLNETLINDGAAILNIPIKIFANLLSQVADRAVELNDKELNKLMLRLTLYESADPDSEDFMGAEELQKYLNS